MWSEVPVSAGPAVLSCRRSSHTPSPSEGCCAGAVSLPERLAGQRRVTRISHIEGTADFRTSKMSNSVDFPVSRDEDSLIQQSCNSQT